MHRQQRRRVQLIAAGRIHAAWNSPLAWVRACRLGEAQGVGVSALTMRDSDRDLTTVVVVRADSPITEVDGLRGHVVGTGAIDSPQATLLPLHHLLGHGLRPGTDFDVRRFETLTGANVALDGVAREHVAHLGARERLAFARLHELMLDHAVRDVVDLEAQAFADVGRGAHDARSASTPRAPAAAAAAG